jgi:hypothetical protein
MRRSEELRERFQLVLDLPEKRYMSLRVSSSFGKRRMAVFGMLRRARLYYSSGDERAALFTLHNAPDSTLRLPCEAEGIQSRDTGMRGMVWSLSGVRHLNSIPCKSSMLLAFFVRPGAAITALGLLPNSSCRLST